MQNQAVVIDWTPAMLKRFKQALAGKADSDVIVFDGHEFLVHYGRYLVEFLDGEFERRAVR